VCLNGSLKRFNEPVKQLGQIARGGRLMSEAAIDVHQHIWPSTLIEALRARSHPPRMRGWTLELAGEPDYLVPPEAHDPEARAAQARADGLALALVSLSSPLGIESLPPGESAELLDAYHEGARGLPRPYGRWAAACLSEIDAGAVERELEGGCVGLQLPATALADAGGYLRAQPLLELLERRDRPLLIHPGPARAHARAPAWWPALVDYVQQMHAAWFAFRAHGRPRHGRLRACFGMLAGLAPLHGERVAARAGERNEFDRDAFLDCSTYGTRALDAVVRALGVDVLVNGSDRPYAEPVDAELGASATHALRNVNPRRLLAIEQEDLDGLAVGARA
jgi:6-methylsalicylate decarboxylase